MRNAIKSAVFAGALMAAGLAGTALAAAAFIRIG